MIVIIASECKSKARERSQLVLDKYLPRIGRRCWSGRISEEGLERLRKELKGEASRSTALICHRVRDRHGLKVAWRIGARSAFDHAGRVPVSIQGRVLQVSDLSLTAAMTYIHAVVVTAALFHDLGKASKPFQDKLATDPTKGDPIRHELLSVGLLLCMSKDAAQVVETRQDPDTSFVELMKDAPRLLKALDKALSGQEILAVLKPLEVGGLPNLTANRNGQFIADVCHLILSHHRLARSQLSERSKIKLKADGYVHAGASGRVDFAAGASFKGKTASFGSKDEVSKWADTIMRTGERISKSSAHRHGIGLPAGMVMGIGRLALMLGDHHASIVGPRCSMAPRVKGIMYANAPRLSDEERSALGSRCGQTLARHLVSVTHAAGVAFHALARHLDRLPSLADEDLPSNIVEPSRAVERFGWQADAADAVRSKREAEPGRGFLAFVMASTGAGKTRAVPAILAASRPGNGLRYSLCLPLRSLTLQSYHEYLGKLGLHPDGVSVAIGSRLVRSLDDLRRRLDGIEAEDPVEGQLEANDAGIETLALGSDAEIEDVGTVRGDPPVFDLPGVIQRRNHVPGMRSEERLASMDFLATPILVCTLDQMMGVAMSTRGGHLDVALRNATSDLVIDELDELGPEDVASVCRLVEHAASYGRHVVVSSATLQPAIARAIHAAYSAGWEHYRALFGTAHGVQCAWLSDAKGGYMVEEPADAATFQDIHAAFGGAIARGLATAPWRRRVAYVETPPSGGQAALASVIRETARRAHEAHAIVDPGTGCRISIGVVRMANMRPAALLAADLTENGMGEGVDVAVVPYVGTLLPAVRFTVERMLDGMLDRRGERDPVLGERSVLRPWLDVRPGGNLCVLVVTTSLEETGRDHDFDFAITEPGAERNIVQLAGRVRRHRPPPAQDAAANVYVLNACLRSLDDPDSEKPFSKPGIETPWRDGLSKFLPAAPLETHVARELYAGNGWDGVLDARHLVRAETPLSISGQYERQLWLDVLEGLNDGLDVSLRTRRPEAHLGDAYQRHRRFRRVHGEQLELVYKDGEWLRSTSWRKELVVSHLFDIHPLRNTSRLLFPITPEALPAHVDGLLEAMEASEDHRLRAEMTSVSLMNFARGDRGEIWRARWHPALGTWIETS